jgi:hypothetical protein
VPGFAFSRFVWYVVLCLPALPGQILPLWIADAPESAAPARFLAGGGEYTVAFYDDSVRTSRGATTALLRFPGGSAKTKPIALAAAPGSARFFSGEHVSGTALAFVEGVVYPALFPGIDLVFQQQDGRLKSEFRVDPGADPTRIRFQYQGASAPAILSDGSLRVEVPGGAWTEAPPYVYQWVAGEKRPVSTKYQVHTDGSIGFVFSKWDPARALIVDPVLSLSISWGSGGFSAVTALAITGTGDYILAGYTDVAAFKSTTPVRPFSGNVDWFVANIRRATGQVLWVSYFGGTADDRAFALALDPNGDIYAAGYTSSTDFPVSPGSASQNGPRDAALLKISPDGTTIRFSKRLGGSGLEGAAALAVVSDGVAVAGSTDSVNFPVVSPAQAISGGATDGFVAKVGVTGTLLWATYFGGSGDDSITSLAADSAGILTFGGRTTSSNLPVRLPLQATRKGGMDGMVGRLAANGSSVLTATYLGGSQGDNSNPESVETLTLDAQGAILVGGFTPSTDYPLLNAWQSLYGGGNADGFITRLSADATTLLSSGYVGGSGIDVIRSVRIATDGTLVAGGSTTSADFPLVQPVGGSYLGGTDGFVSQFSLAEPVLKFSTFLGGSSGDSVSAVVIHPDGTVAAAGHTGSPDFAVQPDSPGSGLRLFLSEIGLKDGPQPVSISPPNGSGMSGSFTAAFAHPAGASRLTSIRISFRSGSSGPATCSIGFTPQTSQIALAGSGGAWQTARLGGSGLLSNADCSLPVSAALATVSGTSLTLTFSLSFSGIAKGVQQILLEGWDDADASSGPAWLGSFTINGSQPPAIVSLTPASGYGDSTNFQLIVSDPNGASDITGVRIVLGDEWRSSGVCYVQYARGTGLLGLADDLGATFQWVRFGSSDKAQNSLCELTGLTASTLETGNILSLNVPVRMKAAFVGARQIFAYAWDRDGMDSGVTRAGSWTVTTGSNRAPIAVSAVLPSGSGSGGTMTFTWSDQDGAADLAGVQAAIGSYWTGVGSCFLYHQRGSGIVALADDQFSGWASVRIGSTDKAANSQCEVDAKGSSVTQDTTTLSLTLTVQFRSVYRGEKRVFLNAWDALHSSSGPQAKGTYVVNDRPVFSSFEKPVSPGSDGTFVVAYTDTNGANDLSALYFHLGSEKTTAGDCFLFWLAETGAIYLVNDAGTEASGTLPGSAHILKNSRCQVALANSSISFSGNLAKFSFSVQFETTMPGKLTASTAAVDRQKGVSAFEQVGLYEVAGSNAAPTILISPSSGNGSSVIFSLAASDGDGSIDVGTVQVLVAPNLRTSGSCFVTIDRARGLMYLGDDQLTMWQPVRPGTSDSASNSQCTLSGTGSSLTEAGNTVTAKVKLQFLSGFSGVQKVFANVTDRKRATTGFLERGVWTVP